MRSWRPLAGLIFLALFCAAALGGDSESGGSGSGGSDPNGPDRSRIRAKSKLSGDRIDVLYDFRDTEQAKDFHATVRQVDSDGNQKPVSWRTPACKPGKLLLGDERSIYWNHSIDRLELLKFTLGGVNTFEFMLRSEKHQTWVQIDEEACGMRIGPVDDSGMDAKDRRVCRLDPTKSHRVELVMEANRAIFKVDGKALLEKPIPKDYVSEGQIGFTTTGDENVHMSAFQLRGTLDKDSPTPELQK